MIKYWKETSVMTAQLALFYLLPLFGMSDPIGMVVLIIIGTFALALLLGVFSGTRLKWLHPLSTGVVFLPTVWIYYNETAMVHVLWYLIISGIGLLIGSGVRWLYIRKQ